MMDFFFPKNPVIRSLSLSFVFIFSFHCRSLFADNVKGEIININHQYQVAFTDIGSNYLATGDIVTVTTNDSQSVYLRVMEASTGISKLGFVDSRQFKTDSAGFGKMMIGNTVTIVSPGTSQRLPGQDPISSMPKTEQIPPSHTHLVNELEAKDQEILGLKKNLQNAEELNRILKEQNSQLLMEKHIYEQDKNKQLEETATLKSSIDQIKRKLQNMGKILQNTGQ